VEDIKFRSLPNANLSNPNSLTIPLVIHQIWKDEDLSTYPIFPSYYNWTERNYVVKLWSEEKVRNLVREEYDWLWPTYIGFPYDIQRADAARLIVLHKEGGIYADLDCYPSGKRPLPLSHWANADLVVPITSDKTSFSNFFIMAPPQSEFLNYTLHRLHTHQQFVIIQYLRVLWSTGPLFLTTMIRDYMKIHPDFQLVAHPLTFYAKHSTGRSWHQWDGLVLSFIGDNLWVLHIPPPLIVVGLCYLWLKKRAKLFPREEKSV
jgi:mannosyltransferase OCH1-like enzyme